MESQAAAAGPRVYVPISHPDSPVPTYAVLQFLGISPPPDPSSQSASLLPQNPLHLLPCSSPVSLPCSSPVSLPCSSPVSSPALKRSSSSSAESSTSSSSDEKDRKLTSLKPSPMKKSASGGSLTPSSLSPGARRNGKILPTISITHTDKDTIIHTHSSNFREVVHQLTGATSGEKGLMPVTLPARSSTTTTRSTAGNDQDSASPNAAAAASPRTTSQVLGGDNGQEAFARNPIGRPTAKLLERRKSNKVLERLSTSCRNLPPLVPSPVTPLASDFEKICLPLTPTTSEGSLTPVLNSAGNIVSLSSDVRAMEILSLSGASPSHERRATLSQSLSAKAMSVDDKGCLGDAFDEQGPRTPQVMHPQSLSLHDGTDAPKPNSTPPAFVDGMGPSLVLATGIGDSSLPEAMDVQNGEETGAHDAMDAESESVQDSRQPNGQSMSLANVEESFIAKKGFFFHSQRPRHGDPTLLSLFPESPREL